MMIRRRRLRETLASARACGCLLIVKRIKFCNIVVFIKKHRDEVTGWSHKKKVDPLTLRVEKRYHERFIIIIFFNKGIEKNGLYFLVEAVPLLGLSRVYFFSSRTQKSIFTANHFRFYRAALFFSVV